MGPCIPRLTSSVNVLLKLWNCAEFRSSSSLVYSILVTVTVISIWAETVSGGGSEGVRQKHHLLRTEPSSPPPPSSLPRRPTPPAILPWAGEWPGSTTHYPHSGLTRVPLEGGEYSALLRLWDRALGLRFYVLLENSTHFLYSPPSHIHLPLVYFMVKFCAKFVFYSKPYLLALFIFLMFHLSYH